MSYSLNIHIWLKTENEGNLSNFIKLLKCYSRFLNLEEKSAGESLYSRVRLYDSPFSIITDKKIETDHLSQLTDLIEEKWQESYHISIDSLYTIKKYDEYKDGINEEFRPADIYFYGNTYGNDNYYQHQRFGQIEISFHNVNHFAVPTILTEKLENSVSIDEGERYLSLINTIESNYMLVSSLVKNIISSIDPLHIVVCTESDINPLVSHTIYHKDLLDFATDLKRIAVLHNLGGLYLSTVNPQIISSLPPWKIASSYGYLRGKYGMNNTDFFSREVQNLADFIISNENCVEARQDIIDYCFTSLNITNIEKIGDSFLLTAKGSPFSYIDEPYFKLFNIYKEICEADLNL